MYKGKSILALIPARSGSQGIKNKNITFLSGKPLLAYTVLAAKDACCFDDIVVSTDSEEIAKVAREWGASTPFIRPAALARNDSKSEPVATHALTALAELGKRYDLLVYLQPTSPLRKASHILACLDFLIDNNLPSLATVSPAKEHPFFMRQLATDGRMNKLLSSIPTDIRRQDLPTYYILNGAIYINRVSDILTLWRGNDNQYGFAMDNINGLDINTHEDLELAEKFLLMNKLSKT